MSLADATRDALGLAREEYFTGPRRALADVAWQRTLRQVSGVIAGAPAVVDLARHDTLPVAVVYSGTGEERARAPFAGTAVLVAFNPVTGDTRAALAMEPEALDDAPESFAAEVHVLDARELLDLPWTPGDWIVGVLVRDELSNMTRVRLVDGAATTPAGASTDVDAALLSRPFVSAEQPALRAPDLPLPAAHERGVTAVLPRVVPEDPGATAHLTLGFRIPAYSARRVALESPAARDGAAAMQPAGIVVVGSARPEPRAVGVVLWCDAEPDASDVGWCAVGAAAVDLLPVTDLLRWDQTHWLYLFVDGFVAGPVACALISRATLADASGR